MRACHLPADTGAKAEFKTGDEEGEFKPCENGNSCTTVHEHLLPIRSTLDPIFEEYGVDFCESTAMQYMTCICSRAAHY
jgi:hypothetical protein